jgi:hypothetical protein
VSRGKLAGNPLTGGTSDEAAREPSLNSNMFFLLADPPWRAQEVASEAARRIKSIRWLKIHKSMHANFHVIF